MLLFVLQLGIMISGELFCLAGSNNNIKNGSMEWPQEIVDEILVVENIFKKEYKTVFYNILNIVYKSKDCFLKSLTKEINLFVDFIIAH